MQHGEESSQVQGTVFSRKHLIIVGIIVFLAAVFAVGIYFAVDLS